MAHRPLHKVRVVVKQIPLLVLNRMRKEPTAARRAVVVLIKRLMVQLHRQRVRIRKEVHAVIRKLLPESAARRVLLVSHAAAAPESVTQANAHVPNVRPKPGRQLKSNVLLL